MGYGRELRVDFAEVTTPKDRVAVIATTPLTRDETWTIGKPGEMWTFEYVIDRAGTWWHDPKGGTGDIEVPVCVGRTHTRGREPYKARRRTTRCALAVR